MTERRGTRVTIGDVAMRAGVSRATVSRVLNGLATVDPSLSERVRAAIAELHYAPSTTARNLALGRTHTVAFVLPDLTNPAFHGSLRGLSLAAGRNGYRVLIADTAENVEEEPLLALEARRRCDAIVLCSPRMPADELNALLPELAPAILLNRDAGDLAPVLAIDYATGARDLARYLIKLGHRRIAYLAGPTGSEANTARLRGFADLADELDLVIIPCGALFSDGYQAVDDVIGSDVTAVMCFNDVVAMGLLGALHEHDVEVPGRFSVVGFDDIPFAQYTSPSLTTASVPQVELGEQAWERLWALLNDEEPRYNVSYRPRVVVRGSTGPVRTG